jgi:hypothetical protein
MSWIDLTGYLASVSVLATFCMGTMGSLRAVAILSNVLFITYGLELHLYPVLLLHLALLPINLLKMAQSRGARGRMSGWLTRVRSRQPGEGGAQRRMPRSGAVKILLICALIVVTHHATKALELRVGDRIPAVPGEPIVVGNDGGLKRGMQVLDFGAVCRVNGWTKNWFLVRRVVAEWTLLELVGPSPDEAPVVDYPVSLAMECPLGTETTRPAFEMKARLEAYARRSEQDFLQSLQ